MDVTILELSFPDAEFNAPFARHPPTPSPTTDDPPSPPRLRPVAIGLVILGVALLTNYLRETRERRGETD